MKRMLLISLPIAAALMVAGCNKEEKGASEEAAKPAAERDERETRLEAERAYVVTWRQGVTVYHRAIDAAEHAALSIFAAGGAFAELCEQLELADPAIIVGYLRRWVADGLVLAGTQEKSETEEASPP